MSLLFDHHYFDFLKHTHPHLGLAKFSNGTPYYVCRQSPANFLKDSLLKKCLQQVGRLLPSIFSPTVLFIGLPFEPYDQSDLLNHLPSKNELIFTAKKNGASMIALTNIKDQYHSVLNNYHFKMVSSLPNSCIYSLAQDEPRLRSRYRYQIKKNKIIFSNAGHKIICCSETQNKNHHHIFSAYRQSFDRAAIKWIPHSSHYVKDFTHIKNSFCLLALDQEDNFLGFIYGIKHGTTAYLGRIGVASKYIRKDAVYFNLIYAGVEKARELGCHNVDLGPTTYEIKKRLGAKFIDLNCGLIPLSAPLKCLALLWLKVSRNYFNDLYVGFRLGDQ